jgi:NitT/TauT family transport system permease protein
VGEEIVNRTIRIFQQPIGRRFSVADLAVLIGIAALIAFGVHLATQTPKIIHGPQISLDPSALPYYSFRSLARMFSAYVLSVIFTLVYGKAMATNPTARVILSPLLDVLQSVPILSFLPVFLLSLSAFLPQGPATELASIFLIFTGQAWNLTFSYYQSLTTIPKELREASSIFRFNSWMRFKTLEFPFSMIGFIWNSMMSWAGGWFFLMAAEIFTVGQRDFRLPGLGAYLQAAASAGNVHAILYGIGTLVLIILLLDQFVWRPLLAWSDRFKVEMVENVNPPTSWFYDLISSARIVEWIGNHIGRAVSAGIDHLMARVFTGKTVEYQPPSISRRVLEIIVLLGIAAVFLYGLARGLLLIFQVTPIEWGQIGLSLIATLIRVAIALLIALAWTIPVGVIIGTNARLSRFLQPLVQILASVPATALFPAFLLVLLRLAHGIDLAAELLMLTGTQWYLLFNVIAGAIAIPQDLKYTATMLGLTRLSRWRTLILPALFPYLITGAITASGGAWNASIVAEHIQFAGRVYNTTGIGSLIASATISGNYPLLLAATLSMIFAVVLINRILWRRLYELAEDQYRLE